MRFAAEVLIIPAHFPSIRVKRKRGVGIESVAVRAVIDWLLRAALVVCQVEATGRWEAAVHVGLA